MSPLFPHKKGKALKDALFWLKGASSFIFSFSWGNTLDIISM